ncbi:DNA-directed RNA polymerase subunit alpha [Candidatus Peregrinibacteria bacterium]|nr:DNA-directed RNA polymerase subunit alpha [Candidatus Peregrinibacteria bacterium]
MHIIQEEIGLPRIKTESSGKNLARFVMEPLPSGYGMTVGNALRRVLLSSLPGAAVSAIKMEGVTHEYTTLPGVQDSVLDIILNLKQLCVRKHTKDPEVVHLKATKEGIVTAKDIQHSSDIEILNPDLYITTITAKKAKVAMDITITKGVGYVPVSLRKKLDQEIGLILVDALYSPVRKVRYNVENTRVGQMTDLDRLIVEVETNGSMMPEESLKFAADLLSSYFNLFTIEGETVEPEFQADIQRVKELERVEEEEESKKESYTPIEILNFSPRTLNSLINGGIGSIEQLVKCTPSKLSNFRGFGKKAMSEVDDALAGRGLKLMSEGEES